MLYNIEMKSEQINIRLDAELKHSAHAVFEALGLSATDAVRLFYKQVSLQEGLPFAVKIPNKKTQRVFHETDQGRNLERHESIDALFASLDE